MNNSSVGIIANPSAGKDIRRLVSHGRVVSNQEKANILRRVFAGIVSTGARTLYIMPDASGLSFPGVNDVKDKIDIKYLDLPNVSHQTGTTKAASIMNDLNVGCIVTLGGDGTNRVVAKGCGQTPILPISTGTNNVFPQMTEGTIAGIAAGRIATRKITSKLFRKSKKINIFVNDELVDIALVDVAITNQMFLGSRAVWDPEVIDSIFLTRSEPLCIGLASIGARIKMISIDEPLGLYIKLNGKEKFRVSAPLAPGKVHEIKISSYEEMKSGKKYPIDLNSGTIALDGEREVELLPKNKVAVSLDLDGPNVVDVEFVHRNFSEGEI